MHSLTSSIPCAHLLPQASLGNTVDDPYSSGAGYDNEVRGIPTAVRPSIKLWFVKLAQASQGILYEDTVMRWWWICKLDLSLYHYCKQLACV